jgi:hypothetical protein
MTRRILLIVIAMQWVPLILAITVLYFFTHVVLRLPLRYVRIVIEVAAAILAAITTGFWVLIYRRQPK